MPSTHLAEGPSLVPETEERRGKVYFIPILGVALVLRIILAVSVIKSGPLLYNQASELSCLAQSLLDGHGFSSPFGGNTGPSAFLAPGYPMMVALAFHFFGGIRSVQAAAVLIAIQIVFGILIVLALMLVARRLIGSQAANIAGVLCAISLTMMWLPALFWETSLSTLFMTGVVALALRCVDDPKRSNWIIIGLFCALGMFVNPALMTTFAAVLAWAACQTRGISGRAPLLAVLTWVLVFSIWPIRNAYRMHAFIPLRTNLGYELWQGNRPGSDGNFSAELHPNANKEQYNRYAQLGEVAFMREKSTLAVAAIKADPARFVQLTFIRAGRFWLYLGGFKSSALLTLELMITSLMSLAGLILVFRRSQAVGALLALPFLVFPLPYYITHPDFRFRLLLHPLALLLTTLVLQECYRYIVSHSLRRSAGEAVAA